MSQPLNPIGLHNGKVYVAAVTDDIGQLAALDCGGAQVPFEPAEYDAQRMLQGANLVGGCEKADHWQADSDDVRVGSDINPAWLVEGESPVFASLPGGVERAVVTYADPELGTDLPITGGVHYEAFARIAAHGLRGELRVLVLDGQGTEIERHRTPFGNGFRGGNSIFDYEGVTVTLTAPAQARAVRYQIAVDERVAERSAASDNAMLLFLRNKLVPGGRGSLDGPELPHETVVGLQRCLRSGDADAVYAAEIDRHASARSDKVEVLRLDAGEPEVVASYELPDTSGVTGGIGPFGGNSLRVAVKGQAGPMQVWVDDEFVKMITPPTGEDGTRVAHVVVTERCDGEPHRVEIRNLQGTRTLVSGAEIFPALLTPWAALQTYSTHPFPSHLAPAARHRYDALIRRIRQLDGVDLAGDADKSAELAQIGWAHEVLERGYENVPDYRPLHFPVVEDPVVSVVIPVHNKFELTYYCLCALVFAGSDLPFEVIVVDDGSSDDTDRLAELAPNVTVARNEKAQGFVRACNLGASKARGEYVVLLNNDTEPTGGWLDELVAAFDRFEDVGMVGSRLLYPDGSLQEAGGIVWGSGNPWNYGRNGNPHDPRYSYARQSDYLSGAALMVSRRVWEEVGGLSDEFAPAYFEDTDLCFKVRDAGYTTWYVPSSTVYHFEGKSNGTDVKAASGLKRFQEVNRPKFKRKWSTAVRNNGQEGVQPDLVKDRGIVGRCLFIDHQVPRPDLDAGSYAAIEEIKLVQSLGFKVTFIAVNLAHMGHYTEDLNKLGVETIYAPFALSVDQFLKDRGSEFDAVFITRYTVATQVMDSVRNHAPQSKVLFNNADLHFLREMRLASQTQSAEVWERATQIRDEELAVMRRADLVLSYNQVEHSVILSHNGPAAPVATCPWVVETRDEDQVPGFSEREGIAFLGGYKHPPNVEAVRYFVDDVLPLLRERLPEVPFNIYGSSMPQEFKEFADEHINPVGFVKTVDEVHDGNRIFVAPLLTGAGIKGKVIGALAAGIPSVLSSVAAESTGIRDEHDALIAETTEEWVEAIARLYDDEEAWTQLSKSAREFTRRKYSFEAGRELMRDAFEKVGFYTRP